MRSGHRRTPPAPTRGLALGAAGVLMAALSGCGGGSGPDPVPSPVPTPSTVPFTEVLDEGSVSGLVPDGAAWGFFTTPRPGTIDIVVDWTFASNDVDLILTRGACAPDQLVADQCEVADIADSPTAKPERVSLVDAPAGTYSLYILNLGATEESLSYQILLTSPRTPGAQGAPSAARVDARRGLRKGTPATFVRLR